MFFLPPPPHTHTHTHTQYFYSIKLSFNLRFSNNFRSPTKVVISVSCQDNISDFRYLILFNVIFIFTFNVIFELHFEFELQPVRIWDCVCVGGCQTDRQQCRHHEEGNSTRRQAGFSSARETLRRNYKLPCQPEPVRRLLSLTEIDIVCVLPKRLWFVKTGSSRARGRWWCMSRESIVSPVWGDCCVLS